MFQPEDEAQRLLKRLRRAFGLHKRGLLTESEISRHFFELLYEASTDDIRAALAIDLPEWARIAVLKLLDEFQSIDFYHRSYPIGDTRTDEQIHENALQRQAMLRQFAPQLRQLLNQTVE